MTDHMNRNTQKRAMLDELEQYNRYNRKYGEQYVRPALEARREYIKSLLSQGMDPDGAKTLADKNSAHPMVLIPAYQELQKIPAQEQIDLYNKELERKQSIPAELFIPADQDRSYEIRDFLERLKPDQVVV